MISAPPLHVGNPLVAGAWEPSPGGSPPRRRPTEVVAWVRAPRACRGCYGGSTPPFVHRLRALHFYGGLELLLQTPPVAAVPHSSPFRLSPCSQQHSSPQVCSLNPAFQPPAPTPAAAHVRLGCTKQWHRPPVYVSLCSACHKPVVLSSEPLELPFCPG